MKLASRHGPGLRERTAFACFRLRKRIRQRLRFSPSQEKTVLFVVGCQRSGTSMIHHLFRLDWDTVTYDEISPLSDGDPVEGLRWNPLSENRNRILADRAPLVVCKPLVESQNLNRLLDSFPRARAIWMYRDFRDVAVSNLEFFGTGNGHDDLVPILAGDETNWRQENLAPDIRERIRKIYDPAMDPHDAAALFWYARNSLFFSRGFAADARVRSCRYGTLVAQPGSVMTDAYSFLGKPYPGDRIVADVFSGSRGRGKQAPLSAAVSDLCGDLLSRLDRCEGLGPAFSG